MMRTLLTLGMVLVWGAGLTTGGGEPKQAEFKLTDAEKKLLALTNAERAKHKLPPLKANQKLFVAARGHSANMAKQGKLAHNLEGMEAGQRAKKAGYRFEGIAENLACGNVEMEEIVKDWMESKNHRENILDPDFTEIGLGLALRGKEDIYYTQVFATPKKK